MPTTPPEIEEIVKKFEERFPGFNRTTNGGAYDFLRTTLITLHQKHQEELEKVIGQHNARILNAFQLEMKPDMPMVCYDERISLIPAMEKATRETLQALTPTKSDKHTKV